MAAFIEVLVRENRYHLINLDKVIRVDPNSEGDAVFLLEGGETFITVATYKSTKEVIRGLHE